MPNVLTSLRESSSCVKEWKISDYRDVDSKYLYVQCLRSDRFVCGGAEWSLEFYPNGSSVLSGRAYEEGNVALYLGLD